METDSDQLIAFPATRVQPLEALKYGVAEFRERSVGMYALCNSRKRPPDRAVALNLNKANPTGVEHSVTAGS